MDSDDDRSDLAELRAEFPAWHFTVRWVAANSGSDARWLLGWSLEYGGPPLCEPDADAMRRAIRQTGATR